MEQTELITKILGFGIPGVLSSILFYLLLQQLTSNKELAKELLEQGKESTKALTQTTEVLRQVTNMLEKMAKEETLQRVEKILDDLERGDRLPSRKRT